MSYLDDPDFRASLRSASDLASAAGHQLPAAHEAILDAIAGAEPTMEERRLWKTLSPMAFPLASALIVLLVAGRRFGKSYVSQLQKIYDAITGEHWRFVLPGQRYYFATVCPELRMSRESIRATEFWGGVLAPLGLKLERRDADGHTEFAMTSPQLPATPVFTIFTANAVSFRGFPLAGLTLDEAGHFTAGVGGTDEANPASAKEILISARPGMLQFQGTARTILCGTPGIAAGLFFDWAAHKPPKGSLLVQAPSWSNGLITREQCERDALDERHLAQEYACARWGANSEVCVSRHEVRACIDAERVAQRPPVAARCLCIDYAPRKDATAIAISRLELKESASGEHSPVPVVIVERIEEMQGRPGAPVLVADVVDRVVALRRAYKGIIDVQYDQFTAPEFESAFRKLGIRAHEMDYSPRAQTSRWVSLFGLVRSRRIVFPDDERIVDQLANLRMTELSSGNLRIESGKGKDDISDAINLCASRALTLAPSGGDVVCVRTPIRVMSEGVEGGQRRWFRRVGPNGRLVPMTPPVGTPEHKKWVTRMQQEGLSTPAMEKFLASQDKDKGDG